MGSIEGPRPKATSTKPVIKTSELQNHLLLLDNKLIELFCAKIENFKQFDGTFLEQDVLLHFL